MSVGKISAVISAIMGLIIGIIYALIGMVLLFSSDAMLGILLISGIILAPLLYGVIGFVSGIIFAAVYNFVAKRFGGIEIEFEK